jgi:hypothetical protein
LREIEFLSDAFQILIYLLPDLVVSILKEDFVITWKNRSN